MTATTAGPARTEADEARDKLRELLKPGDTVYTVLRHVSRSGMSRHIDLYVIRDDVPEHLSGLAARALGWRQKVICGTGMDMGHLAVYSLSRAVFATEPGDGDAGYLLDQRWL